MEDVTNNIDEDIKIVEEQLNTYKRHLKNYEKDDCLTSVYYELKKYAQSLENLLSRLKTAERMNDVLAEQNVKSCEWYFSEFDNYTKDDFIEWARKKVEDES